MPRHGLSTTLSHLVRRLIHGVPNRRARRAMRQKRTSTRLALESLESRVLLSSYIVEDLGTLGGIASQANAINAKGEVVGQSGTKDGAIHAVLWDPGKPAQDLGTLGGTNSSATAINILGEIVGAADTTATTNPSHPFDLKPGGSMTDLSSAPPQSSFGDSLLTAKGVSDTGVIVGKGSFNVIDGFETSPYAYDPPTGTLTQLDASLAVGEATAIAGTRAVANLVKNNLSQAVIADINTPNSSVALPAIANQKQSHVYTLSAPNGSGVQYATGDAIDSSGGYHVVLWTIPADPHSATVTDLGHLPGAAANPVGDEGLAVNSLGDVVGEDSQGLDAAAFVRNHDGTMTLLDSLLPSGSGINLLAATGINDAGQICATGTINGQEHAFRLTPVLTAPPHVTLSYAPDIDSSVSTKYSFIVTYDDETGIDTSTLANAIQVTGPNGFSQTASFSGDLGSPTHLAAVYTITAPGGTWDFTDNGTYTVTLNNNVVKDLTGQPLAGGTLGHFIAAINVTRGSISGTVYSDVNDNGKRDPSEGGMANTDVFIDANGNGSYDSGEPLTRTNDFGTYSFPGLLPGTYRVVVYVSGLPLEITDPPITDPLTSNDVQVVHLSEGQNATGVNFGAFGIPQITDIAGQNLVNPHGMTAQFDQPATVLHISGANFNPADTFYFGNDQAAARPMNFQTNSYGVQTFDLQVPKYATTGPLVVVNSNTNHSFTLLSTFTVDSYRNVNGYSFTNDGKTPDESANEPNFSFDELTTVYGSDQTDISVFGIDTGITNPLASLELDLINSALAPSNGECVGFSLSSARLMLGLQPTYSINGLSRQIGDFPATDTGEDTASTVSQLANSPSLRQLIRLAHLEQTSGEVLVHYVTQIAADEVNGVSNLIKDVKSELAQGRPVPIGFLMSDGGHCVLAYNVEDGPNGSEILDVYDPDLPFVHEGEDNNFASSTVLGVEDGTFHKGEVDGSTIVFSRDGHWTYHGGAGNASGGLGSIAPIPLSTFDSHTLLAGSLTGLLTLFVFGSAAETQVTDSSDHTLLGADGSPNTNPNTMIHNAARYDLGDPGSTPLDLIQGPGNFMQTITGTSSGTYGAASLGTDAMATISDISTAKGQADQFGLDPSNDKLTFTPGATKNLNADLMMNAADGTVYEAQVSSNAVGGTQTLQFQGGQVEFQAAKDSGGDTKPTESISLNFGHVDTKAAMQTFSTGRITLAAGESVDVLPSDWNNLQNATAAVTIHHKDGTTTKMTLTNAGQGTVLNAKEGVATPSTVVASFPNQSLTGKSAVIDWGDGTTSTGTVSADGPDVFVAGSHTYAKQGYYTTHATLSDANGQLGQAAGEAIVTDTRFTLASASIAAFAGVPFSGKVATLTDIPSGDVASDFDVKIEWGDGTSSAGTLQMTAAGKFDVRGSHTWATTGNKALTITVTEHGTASGQGQTIDTTSSTKFSGTIGQLNLPIPGSAPSDYVATIDWGDGTTSAGTLTLQADGLYLLSGSHSYATGSKSYVTHFTVTGGPSANTKSSAVVSSAAGTVTGTLYNDINGNGKMDAGEEGIPGQVVFIDLNNNGKLDSGEAFAVTNSSGLYTISNAPAGNIRVMESVPSGFRVSAPATGSYNVTLNAGQTLSNLNLANTQLAQISGTVFIDGNGNGKQDPSEPGRGNQIVYLDLNNDGVQQSTEPTAITDSTGAFAFAVTAGSYVVRLQSFSDFTMTAPAGGSFSVTVGVGATNSSSLFGEHLILPVGPPPPPPPPSPPGGGGSPTPNPAPPTLQVPPLLAFFDSLLGAVETINGNGTETLTDSIFGIPLLVSTFDSAGKLESVLLLGINVTTLFELF